MPQAPVPNTAQLTLKWVCDGENIQNTIYFERASGWSSTQLQVLLDAIEAAFTTHLDVVIPIECTLIEAIATDLTSLNHSRVVKPYATALPGVAAGGAAPLNATFAIKQNTGKRGRGRAGRIFHPALPEEEIGAGKVSSAFATSVVTAWTDFITALEAASGGTQVVVHRVLNGAPLDPADTDPVLSLGYADLNIDSQKNRLPGHKRRRSVSV